MKIKTITVEKIIQKAEQRRREYEKSLNESSNEILNKNGVSNQAYLEIKLIEATDLKPLDFNGRSDPYVVFELDGQKEVSSVKETTLYPIWNELFTLQVSRLDTFLYVKVYDKDQIGSDDLEGVLRINLLDLKSQLPQEEIYELFKEDYVTEEKGTIRLRLHLVYSKKKFNADKLKACEDKIQEHEEILAELNKFKESLAQPFGLIFNGDILDLAKNDLISKKVDAHRLTAAYKPMKHRDSENIAKRVNAMISGAISTRVKRSRQHSLEWGF